MLYLAPLLTSGSFALYDAYEHQEVIVNAILAKYPGMAATLGSNVCALIDPGTTLFQWTVYIGVAELLLLVVCAAAIWALSLVHLRSRKRELSKRTYQLHKQLIIALALQFLVPGVALVLPYSLLAVSLMVQTDIFYANGMGWSCCRRDL